MQNVSQCAEGAAEACGLLIEDPNATPQQKREAFTLRATLKRGAGDITGALRDYDAALALDATHAPALLGRGDILFASGQLDAATPLLERAVDGDQTGRAQHLLGRIALLRSDYAGAITHFDAAVRQDPHLAEALAARARAKQHSGDNVGARADYDAAIRTDDALAEARAGRCWLNLTEETELPQARNDAEAATAADPRLVEAQLCRGILQLQNSEWAGARVSFEAALQVESGNPTALFGRGVARRRSGDNAGTRDMNQARDFDNRITRTFAQWGVDTY